MVLRTVGRIILVPLGFVLAAAAAMAVLVTLGLERFTHVAATRKGDIAWIGDLIDIVRHGRVMASMATLVPAVLAVVVGEVARIRSWTYYMLAGRATIAAVPLLARVGESGLGSIMGSGGWQVFATAGFAGGIVYWAVAGRSA